MTLGIVVLLALAVASGWLVRRAWRAGHPALRWSGIAVGGLLALVFTVLSGAALRGVWMLTRTHDNPVPDVTVQVTPERVARGARFEPFCAGCHAPDPASPLVGQDFLGADAPPVGRLWAPNLTPVHLADWSDGEILRAIREGIHRSGRALLIMPSRAFRHLSDEDLLSIVAWLRSLPPAGEETPPRRFNVLGALLLNVAPLIEAQEPVTESVTAPPPGPTAEYGEYLASFTCRFCHGEDLGGDPAFESPGLVGAGVGWTEEQFIRFMRTGTRPDGSVVDGEAMPWRDLIRFLREDEELRAIHAHLATLGG